MNDKPPILCRVSGIDRPGITAGLMAVLAPIAVGFGLGVGALAMVADTFAATLRRPALAGLPIAALVAVPATVGPDRNDVFLFALACAAYLVLLRVHAPRRDAGHALGVGALTIVAALLAPLAPAIAAAGLGVLLVAGSTGAIVVALLLGISQGLCLGIAYGQIVQFATSPAHAGSVSAVTSAVGIALAAIGPLAFGSALEATGKSVVPVVGLGAVLVVHLMVGLRTGTLVDRR